jgi:L-alanine-DL-glutamate epimerase-like enolase superfamily enzyme
LTSEAMTALRAMLADMQASLVERLARRFDGGNLALLGTVGTALAALDRAGVDSAATGRSVVVCQRPGGALTVVVTRAEDAEAVELDPHSAIALAGELIAAALPGLAPLAE